MSDLMKMGLAIQAANLEAQKRLDAAVAALREKIGGTPEEWAAGARVADDCHCSCCGRRGVVGMCQTCEGSNR